MNQTVTVIGCKSDLNKVHLLLRDRNDFTTFQFGKNLFQNIQSHLSKGIILLANKKTIGSATKVLEFIQTKLLKTPVVVVSTIKDVDLLYNALKVNLVEFVVDFGNHIWLQKEMVKSLRLIEENQIIKSVLAIGAHPDDIEIGCGGTLLKHQQQKHKISILTLTKGSIGGNQNQRAQESLHAANHLRASLHIHELEDTKISEGNPTINIILDTIKECKPDIIYTHSYNDNHQDHRATHKATLVAGRGIANIYSYLAPSTNVSFHPRHFEVIDEFMEEKQELINYHISQTQEKARPYLTPEVIKSTATYWGRFANYAACEPYEVIKS